MKRKTFQRKMNNVILDLNIPFCKNIDGEIR